MSDESIRQAMQRPPGQGAPTDTLLGAAGEPTPAEPGSGEPPLAPVSSVPPNKAYIPNQISVERRTLYVALSIAIVLYGALGAVSDDIYVPGRRSHGFHAHGPALWIVVVAAIALAANLLVEVVDHYDRRNNERHYDRARMLLVKVSIGLVLLAVVLDVAVWHRFSSR